MWVEISRAYRSEFFDKVSEMFFVKVKSSFALVRNYPDAARTQFKTERPQIMLLAKVLQYLI